MLFFKFDKSMALYAGAPKQCDLPFQAYWLPMESY